MMLVTSIDYEIDTLLNYVCFHSSVFAHTTAAYIVRVPAVDSSLLFNT